MALVVNTNVSSLVAQYRLEVNSQSYQKSLERLSSGYRINRASDDAAGLTIYQNMQSQIRRMQQASRNTQDGISVLQVAEGSLSTIGENLQRIRELTIQAANDTNDANARASIDNEIQSLANEIDRIAAATNFNGINLLDGTATDAVIQIGPNSNAVTNVVDISSVLTDTSASGLSLVGGAQTFANIAAINLTDTATAQSFLTDIDVALQAVNTQRSLIGSYQNKLESVIDNLSQAVENFSTSVSRIRDVDVAAESANLTQSQLLTQAATSILAQSNQLPQMVLSLLQQK